MGVLKLVVYLFGIILGLLVYKWMTSQAEVPSIAEDGWFGSGPKPDVQEDTKVTKISVKIQDLILKDLKERLKKARLSTDLEDGDFNYGFQVGYLRTVMDYWTGKYDWRKHENILNSFDHYKTTIEGINIHFIHQKPKNATKVSLPLLLVHGWPGSVWEFYKLIPLLTESHLDVTFEIVAPSIPGYGFSGAPRKKGFDQAVAARIFRKLMKRLGYDKFYTQGGDWGALITSIMAAAYPDDVIGFHSNMPTPSTSMTNNLKQAIGYVFPWLFFEQWETEKLYPISKSFIKLLVEFGYFHLQATRPDTIGIGLTDSPVGLAAYILEKFGVWTNDSFIDLPDCGLTEKFTMDELLTNVMIYWTNANIASSMRFYKEAFTDMCMLRWSAVPVHVPSSFAQFPYDLAFAPKALLTDKYSDIVQWTYMPRGGHFAALEEPHLLAGDLRNFVRKVEKRRQGK